jgi:hypothetical protein
LARGPTRRIRVGVRVRVRVRVRVWVRVRVRVRVRFRGPTRRIVVRKKQASTCVRSSKSVGVSKVL